MNRLTKAMTIKKKIEFWTKRYNSPINEMPNQEIQADCKRLDWIKKAEKLLQEIDEGEDCGAEQEGWYGTPGHYCCRDCHDASKLLSNILTTQNTGIQSKGGKQ